MAARVKRFVNLQDDLPGAFPASEATPGQAESRAAFERFNAQRDDLPWWNDYLALRQDGWDWRKAAFIAWLSLPSRQRRPKTQAQLADLLGLRSDRTLRHWMQDDERIREAAAGERVALLFQHRRDVLDALVAVAKRHDHLAHSDRKLFLEMTGDHKPRGALALTGEQGGPVGVVDWSALAGMSDDELEQFIANLQTANGGGALGAKAEDGREPGFADVDNDTPADVGAR